MLSYMLSQYIGLLVPEATIRSWLGQWLSEQESRYADEGFSTRFPWRETRLCQEYFLQRKSKIDGKQFLTDPRYQGGDINKPFIDIVGMDSELNHTALGLISKEWSQLRAQHARTLVPGQSFPQDIPDQYICTTSFSDPPEFNGKFLALQVATYEDFDWCCQALGNTCKHAWQTIRELSASNLVAANDEKLCDHISEGEVHIVYESDVRVGLLVCQKGNLVFLRGYRITDKIILPAFHGRSLSARAQCPPYRLLTHSNSELSLYMDTIIPENVPSMKTAEKAERTCVLSHQFLPIRNTHDQQQC